MKKLLIILMTSLLLVGCARGSSDNNEIPDNDTEQTKQVLTYTQEGSLYQVLIPFSQSDIRMYHGNTARQDRLELSQRLQEMSTTYFDPAQYYVSEGTVITAELHNRLIKYESLFDEGLNPRSDQVFETTGSQSVTGPVIVTDVVSMDFYSSRATDAEVTGIAIAITLNKSTTLESGAEVELSEDTMIEWGESAARKLVSIVRGLSGMTNVPIFVALYSLEKQDSTLPGGYVSSAFFEGRAGQFVRNKEEWLLFPSSDATSRVNQLAVEFDLYKQSLGSLIQSETTGVIGQGRLINNEIDHLKIEINTSGRTFLEVQALTQYAASLLERFNQFEMEITVQVKILDKVTAIVSRGRSTQEVTIVYL